MENLDGKWLRVPPSRAQANALVGLERGIAASTPLLACSACAGDYEDPDRTAWPDDAEKADSRGDEQEVDGEKIPAGER